MNEFQTLQPEKARGLTVTVGADAACDYQIGPNTTLQDAINSGAETILLATNSPYAPVVVSQSSVVINLIGGFANCTDANNNILSSDKSVIAGLPTDVVLAVNDANLQVHNVQLTDGLIGLGIINFLTSSNITLKNVTSNFNQHGIRIENSTNTPGTQLFAEDIKIHNNTAISGSAGILCEGIGAGIGHTSITVVGNSGIYNNQSDIGGGFYLLNCDLLMIGGDDIDNTVGIRNNIANQVGGGGAVLGTSKFTGNGGIQMLNHPFSGPHYYGNHSQPLVIADNTTNGAGSNFGGGLLVSGSNAVALLSGVAILRNQATRGAGLYATFNSQVFITRPTDSCWSDINCNYIGMNEATQAGGGIYAINDVYLQINHTRISKNRASRGVAALINGTNTNVRMETVTIDGNGDGGQNGFTDINTLAVEGNADFEAQFTTIIDNNSVDEVIKANNANLALFGSYLYNPIGGSYLTETGSNNINANCLILDDANNLPSDGTLMSNTDYMNAFRDTAAGDYRTLQGALGIDFCDDQNMALLTDINNRVRGYDDPYVVNQNSNALNTYDIGTHENYGSDIIFEDDFDPTSIDL